MALSNEIDWGKLARDVGAIGDDRSEHSNTILACRAIESIVGTEFFRSAVDHYVNHLPGSELARSVLWHIHPWSAMERCYELYNDCEDLELRRSAIELLRVVADGRVLPWVPGLLEDPDDSIQWCGGGIVDQLLWSNLMEPNECGEVLAAMAEHSSKEVRKTYEFIQSYLKSREDSAEPARQCDAGKTGGG